MWKQRERPEEKSQANLWNGHQPVPAGQMFTLEAPYRHCPNNNKKIHRRRALLLEPPTPPPPILSSLKISV